MSARRAAGLVLVALLALAARAAAFPTPPFPSTIDDVLAGGERIRAFDSHITVAPDGELTVTETIAVIATGAEITRGIFRDFPTIYPGPWGTRVAVPFTIVRVTRDGADEPYHTESAENGTRVYIGRRDTPIAPGPHTYTLTYRTARQLGFFATHDELYWNVTGNGWSFPIDAAAATVVLPAAIPRERVTLTGYTGAMGSTARELTTEIAADGTLHFRTTRPLDPYEGLTIVATFPTGFIAAPDDAAQRAAWLASNPDLLAGAAGLAVVLAYYLLAWLAVGRDPARGTIIPLFAPPLGLDAAGLGYVAGMGYDERCFTAALVGLGVKGWVRIAEGDDGVFTLTRVDGGAREPLSGAERELLRSLLSGTPLRLEQANHARVRGGIRALRSALALEYDGAMFRQNRRWLWPGLALSVATLLAVGAWGRGGAAGGFATAFLLVWLGVWTYAVLHLVENVTRGWRDALRPGISITSRVFGLLLAVIVTAISLPFLAGEAFGLFALTEMTTVWSAPLLLALAAAGWLFAWLLKQPTRAGRAVMDQIDGFRMYLTTAEGDELRLAPPRTPAVFEAMLPFAIALGVEHAWSARFADVLAAAAERGETGTVGRRWYSGTSSGGLRTASFSSALAGAISSSSSAPGSRSGSSSGGSSGGGGGGGGGGGW